MIREIFVETLERTLGLAGVILVLLLVVEYLNHRYGDKLLHFFEKRQKFLPFWAALLGLLPGCNAAAAVSVLFARGYVAVGAVVAAIIATSDEAIYVFIPQGFNFLPLYAAKFVLAVAAGFIINFFVIKGQKRKLGQGEKIEYCCAHHEHFHDLRGMFVHTLRHGLKIALFIFIVLFSFNYIKDTYGFEKVAENALIGSPWQPFLASLVGFIPGCGTSVVLATLYTQGILSFASALAGLSVAAGDALVVLFANKVDKKSLFLVIAGVFLFSLLGGYLVSLI